MTSETNENTYGGSGLKTSDTTAMERLRLVTTGYIYHPRSILFRLGGAGGSCRRTSKARRPPLPTRHVPRTNMK